MIGFSYAYEGNDQASLFSPIISFDSINGEYELIVVMNSVIGVLATLVVERQVLALMESLLTSNTTMMVAQILTSVMSSLIQVGTSFPLTGDTSIWVVNSDTTASSRYENFNFNSYAKLGDAYYGMAPDGLYSLNGEDDSGVLVDAMLSFGKRNFGTSFLKRAANAYIGVSSGGTMYLKVLVEGKEYVYRIRGNDPNLKAQRFDLGKGLRSTYFEFELYNQGGADFELDSVEFVAAVLQRRI
jgi:hypothetical protein